jgi:bis(5'-nucleosidyl)-tetraphosphatase
MLHEKSCGAVVYTMQDSTVYYLLLQYEAGHWDFVKGNVEAGETEQETAVRELGEETGITDARFIDGFRERISYYYKRRGQTVLKEVVFFLMEAKNTNIKLSFEHISFAWMPYNGTMEKLTFKNARDTLQRAEEHLIKQGIIKQKQL